MNYWPWWLGGASLALVALVFPVLTGVPLGVSGTLARLLRWWEDVPQAGPVEKPTVRAGCDGGGGGGTPSIGRHDPDRLANFVFLAAVVAGGAAAGVWGGQGWGRSQLSPEFHRLFGTGIQALLILFGGGILVGFGTRLSGGCTSGHGLSGCGRLQPASLVATGVFFGVAIGTSFVLERILS